MLMVKDLIEEMDSFNEPSIITEDLSIYFDAQLILSIEKEINKIKNS